MQKVIATGELYESPTSAELEELDEDEIIDLIGDTIRVVHGHDIYLAPLADAFSEYV